MSLLGCSLVPVSEAEVEEIEIFLGNLHEQHHEPHHAAKFDAAAMPLRARNLLVH